MVETIQHNSSAHAYLDYKSPGLNGIFDQTKQIYMQQNCQSTHLQQQVLLLALPACALNALQQCRQEAPKVAACHAAKCQACCCSNVLIL
jgi:hypothetical protein